MKEVNRKVQIVWKYNPTVFENINKDVLGEMTRLIGSSVSAVNKIITQSGMIRMLMPQILGISPDAKDVNWEARVRNHWDSLSVPIESGGKTLETGFIFDIGDSERKEYISQLKKEHSFTSSNQLADFVMGVDKNGESNIREEDRWKYGTPINVEHYLLWRYLLNYRPVANTVEDVNKSPNIRFYLYTQEEQERAKKERMKIKQTAITKYMKFMENAQEEDLNNALSVLSPESVIDIVKTKNFEEKQMELMTYATETPVKFVDVITDKALSSKANINKLIAFGVFKRVPGTSSIIDSSDASVIVGNNMDDAVSFMNNEKNAKYINEITVKYKSLINK